MPAAPGLQEKVYEQSVKWVYARPLTFEEFLDLFGPKDYVELIDGVVVERPMVQLDHEKLELWLVTALHLFVKSADLGIVLHSRFAVEIDQFRGRLPDLLFVRNENMGIVQQKAVFGPPDLVIEIVSPNDRRSDLVALETDYRRIGVSEIVFIDQPQRRVRILRKRNGSYREEIVTSDGFSLRSLKGIRLQTDWLFDEPRPDERATVDDWLGERLP
jgi:Uma2 family endonuclease